MISCYVISTTNNSSKYGDKYKCVHSNYKFVNIYSERKRYLTYDGRDNWIGSEFNRIEKTIETNPNKENRGKYTQRLAQKLHNGKICECVICL